MADYHHTVTGKSTPSVEFTKWCSPTDNCRMEKNPDAAVRRENLKSLLLRDFGDNRSEIARMYNPDDPKPSYFSDLVRPGSKKSFAEKAARAIEAAVGLKRGQLDIPNSPLLYDDVQRNRVREDLQSACADLNQNEQREALAAIRRIKGRRRKAG